MKTLEEKKAEIQRKMQVDIISAEFEHEICTQFPELKILAYARDWKEIEKTANFELNSIEEFQKVYAAYQPTNKETVIGFAGKENQTINHPVKVMIGNPPVQNSSQRFEIKFDYNSGDINIRINMPINKVKDFVSIGRRKPTSSEHHYFTGYSKKAIMKMDLTAYSFNKIQINWYGGDKTLKDTDEIQEIIKFLTK
jgi:hypothetical protein